MNVFLTQQIDLLRVEEKLERIEFENLLNDVESNINSPIHVISTIEKWANGHYLKLSSENIKFPYNTGELVTLIGNINISGTVLFDDGNHLILFTRDKVDLLSIGHKLRIISGSKNTYTYDVQHRAIRRISKALGNNRLVTNILKGRYIQSVGKKLKLKYKLSLNQYQNAAIEHCIRSRDFACIFGPPGTGKTTTLSELIHQLVLLGETVLVSCPSNAAVDALYSKTISIGVSCVRIGKGALVKELLLNMSKNERLNDFNNTQFLISNDQGSYSRRLKLLKTAKAVFTTCVGINSSEVEEFTREHKPFDTLIIDESGNSLESMSYIGLLTGVKRVIFSGDHFQLPPNVKSPITPMSILERLSISTPMSFVMLKRQYRMNHKIAEWSNKQFYCNELESDPSVKDAVLNEKMIECYPPIIWYDIESKEKVEGGSKYNRKEALCVVDYARILLSTVGIYPESVTIITPYKAQSRLLHELIGINNNVNITSIDASQGSESDVVILSLVSCNHDGDVGFMNDYRRMNVAITRGKRHVAIFGSANTFQLNHQPYRDLVKSIKFGKIWWHSPFIKSKCNFMIHLADYLIKYYNKLTNEIDLNGYMCSSNLKLARYCKSGYITNALQFFTPNPLSNVIMALYLLDYKEESNYTINTNVNCNNEIKLSHTHYMKIVLNSLSSSDRNLVELIDDNLNMLYTVSKSNKINASVKSTDIIDVIDTCSEIVYSIPKPDIVVMTCNNKEDNSVKINIGKPNKNNYICKTNLKPSVNKGAANTKKNKKNNKINKTNTNVNNIDNTDDDIADLDALLNEFHKCSLNINKKDAVKCDKNTSLFGVNCKLCKLRFCIKHGSPEKHNCHKLKR